jgi:peptide/bleomycin uptake transporter
MFESFFPRPRAFFTSAVAWTLGAVLFWFFFARHWGGIVGLPNPPADAPPLIGVQAFWSGPFLWFYLYYALVVGLFAAFWAVYAPHPWFRWSVLGSAFIIFAAYFQVEVSVAVNKWYGPFWDLIQAAVSKSRPVTTKDFVDQLLVFAGIAFVAIFVGVMTRFFVSHYIFRWRTAMNDLYTANWSRIHRIEGAAQRVQDDTMRFASTMEGLGVSFIDALMTLIAFLPVLHGLEAYVSELPLIGAIPYPLVTASVLWSLLGTVFMYLIGIRLPGLYFNNQRVEAAYRKVLVMGEERPEEASPPKLHELFGAVRHNYFRLYWNYTYFNLGRIFYLQTDNIFPFIVLIPSLVAGKITLGPLQQILSAFGEVRSAFQFLINSWSTIVEMQSIYKRLRAFDAVLHDEPLGPIELAGNAAT